MCLTEIENEVKGELGGSDVRGELESIGRCLKGEELVKALMERVVAAEEEKATLAGKVEELSRVQKEAGTLRKQNEIVSVIGEFCFSFQGANKHLGGIYVYCELMRAETSA